MKMNWWSFSRFARTNRICIHYLHFALCFTCSSKFVNKRKAPNRLLTLPLLTSNSGAKLFVELPCPLEICSPMTDVGVCINQHG